MNIDIKNDVWTVLKQTDKPLIIYGMGNGADKILNEFEKLDIKIYGVIASDDFVRGQSFRGFTVKKLFDIENELDDFIIITAFGTSRPDVINHIVEISKKHTVLSADVSVYGDNIFNMEFYRSHYAEIEQAYSLMADEQSQKVFENEICFKLSGNLQYLFDSFSDKDEVFKNILKLSDKESYLDLGAYRGDTIQEFLSYTDGHYSSIVALEPDRKTFQKLKTAVGNMKSVQLFNMGIWSDDCDMTFNASLGRGSSISSEGKQSLAVTKVDTLFRARHLTYMKMDVEGAEYMALKGAENTLRRDCPKLNIAAYHRSEDIFTLPIMIHEINPEYKIFLRQHPHIPAWDMNIYAVGK
ncbi:MAG: FkbM family methyltransferase [Clostridia bacterium]|nr:FkbM family methyltransferase [Clostridia bacterium]